jgi:drug/metabolite transporter (DMT)-like permease
MMHLSGGRGCYTIEVAIVLALISALLYGVSDYVGGRVSRSISPLALITAADGLSLVVLAVFVPRFVGPVSDASVVWWGGAAGLVGVVGVLFLYRALADGAMTVVAPVTALVAAALPVVVGLATGDRPGVIALIGIAAALISVALISGAIGVPHVATPPRIFVLSIISGAGFGLLFVFYERAGSGGIWWPLLSARAVGFPVVLIAFVVGLRLAARRSRPPSGRSLGWSVLGIGAVIAVLGGSANLSYIASSQRGLLAIIAVVVSMYPAATVALATLLDGERLRRPQALGLGLAVIALVLVAA